MCSTLPLYVQYVVDLLSDPGHSQNSAPVPCNGRQGFSTAMTVRLTGQQGQYGGGEGGSINDA